MVVGEDELERFANDILVGIEMRECDTNAIKVFDRYGGKIMQGIATFVDDKGKENEVEHFWNLLTFVANGKNEDVQLIDIINYKAGTAGKYIQHRGGFQVYKEQLEKSRKFFSQTLNA